MATSGVDRILASRPYRRLPAAAAEARARAWAEIAARDRRVPAAAVEAVAGGGAPSAAAAAAALRRRASEPEYLVRWAGKAYWHCSWVPESFLAGRAKMKLKNFKQRQAQAQEVSVGAAAGAAAEEEAGGDDEEEAVINPAWLQVDRVLDERRERSLDGRERAVEYRVRWAGLEYEDSTWELLSDLVDRGFEAHVRHYLRRDQDWLRPLEGGSLSTWVGGLAG